MSGPDGRRDTRSVRIPLNAELAQAWLTRVRKEAGDEEPETRPLDLGLLRRLFGYARPYATKRNWLIACVVVRSLQLPLLGWAMGAIIAGPIERHDSAALAWAVAGYATLALSTVLVFHWRQLLALELGESVVHDLRAAIFAHLQRQPLAFFHKTRLGRIISRVTNDVDAVRTGVQDVLFISVVQAGQMLGAAAFMIWCDWRLFLVVLGMAPILWGIGRVFRTRISTATRAVQESFSRVTAILAESVNGIRVTQGFGRERLNGGLFAALVHDHARYNIEVVRSSALFGPLLEFNNQLFVSMLLLLGGWLALHQGMALADLIQFLFLAGLFFGPIHAIGNQYNQALVAMAGAERVFRFLDTPPAWEDDAAAAEAPLLQGRVEFRDVTFGYDPREPVLHDVSFTAESGQTVALVGHTGSGKSTIANLVAKLYLPTAGEIRFDGREIRTVTGRSLRRQMGVVLQTNFLFHGTVADNIRIARPEATDADIAAAALRLDCLDVLEGLPQGLATVVGEKGAGLSLGQRQLVCFTRAMLADPRIVILDEATSAVDALTEARLQKALGVLLGGRTSFVIAHRLSTIRAADQILVLDHGRIVERGRHAGLLELGGHYARLHAAFARAAVGE